MAVEMTASRMLENIYSTTNIVWACIIGSILIYLAVGNWIGGKAADRFPGMVAFSALLILSGISICLIPLISKPLLYKSALAMDEMAFFQILSLFFLLLAILIIPMTMLGMITPYALSLYTKGQTVSGSSTGQILAISTLGSFIGTLIPVFILIPWCGTSRSFTVIGGFLLLIGIVGMILFSVSPLRFVTMLLILIPIFLFITISPKVKISKDQIFERESAYNYIEVLNNSGYSILRLNDGQAIQSIYKPDQINYYGPWEQILTAPFLNKGPVDIHSIREAAILGLAGGTSARQLIRVFPEISVDGYEIDPEVIETARNYMGLKDGQLAIHLTDGRLGLIQSKKSYDIIMVDAYQPPYIAPNMCTVEFFRIAASRLSQNGILVMNIGRSENDRRLLESINSTVGQVFTSVCVVDVPNTYNSVLFAAMNPINPENLTDNYMSLSSSSDTPQLLLETLSIAIGNIQKEPEKKGIIFSDDFVPVERITNRIILRAISGE